MQIQSKFSTSAQLFLLHLPPARVKTWTGLCLPQATRRAGVLLAHVMSMQKMAHWSVQDLPGVLQELLLHTHNVKINLASERLLSNQTVVFPLAVDTKFCSSPCQAHLLKAAAHPVAAAAACSAPQYHHESLQSDRYICRQSRLLQ